VASIIGDEVIVKYEDNYSNEEKESINKFLSKVDFVYIPTSRSLEDKEHSWYSKMIDFILKNKAENIENEEVIDNLENIVQAVKKIITKDDNINFNN
jgi:hypothetical protein